MNKYIRAISTNYLFFAFNSVLYLVFTSIAIRVMGEEFYGLWTILNAILNSSGLGMFQMNAVVNKFASEKGEKLLKPESILTAGIIILLPMATLISGVLLFSRELIMLRLGISNDLQHQFTKALVIIALSVYPMFLTQIPLGYLLSQLKNKFIRIEQFAMNAILWIGIIVIAVQTRNLVYIAFMMFFIQAIHMVILFMIVKKLSNFKWCVDKSVISRMLNFSFFSFMENIAIILFSQIDRVLVGFVLGPSAAGVYSVATGVGLRLTGITKQATEVMIPYASLHNSIGNREKLYTIFRKLVSYISISLAAIASILIIWMPEILSVWISQSYSEKYTSIFRIVVLAYGLFTLGHPGRQTLMGIGKVKCIAFTYLSASTIMITLVYFLAKYFDLTGAAWANVSMLILILLNIFSYRMFKYKTNWIHAVSDMILALLLPACAFYFVSQFHISILQKIIISLVSLTILLFVFLKLFPESKHLIKKFRDSVFYKNSSLK